MGIPGDETSHMENKWNDYENYYETLEVEKYHKYLKSDEWQQFLSCEKQLKEFDPKKILEQKKNELIQSYSLFLSPNTSSRFLNNELIQEIIGNHAFELETIRNKLSKRYTLDSFPTHLEKLSLNNPQKIRMLCEPSEHFEKRGKFAIHMLIPLVFTILILILLNLLGVTSRNATDTAFSLFRILTIIIFLIIAICFSYFILSYARFFSNSGKIAAVFTDMFIVTALFAACYYLCSKYIRPTQKAYEISIAVMGIILFAAALLISELSFVPSYVIKKFYKTVSSFKKNADSRYCKYMMQDKNMEIIAISYYLDDILITLINVWSNKDSVKTELRNIYLEMERIMHKAKLRAIKITGN